MTEILGVDIGGTFTDFVLLDEGKLTLHKRLTSPDDPARAFLAGLRALEVGPRATVVHGSTMATNALLERRGARTALITTRGFADVLEIGRQNRPDLYALTPRRPPPLVPRHLRFELDERVTAGGAPLLPLDPAQAAALLPQLAAHGVEAVAVCFLFSFLHPQHEQAVAGALRAHIPYLSLSSELLPEYREYERTSTTVINAYVTPLMDRYLARLEAGLAPRPLRIMQSNGGAITAAAARRQAARTALSGPAGGVVGAFAVAREALSGQGPAPREGEAEGVPNIITFDMGGTSADVCLCPGRVPLTTEGEIGGLPLRLPLIDIHTVGAGGGSLARVDPGGALTVGPESAGADPGPACYGRGGRAPTVTDANLLLGRLDADHFLDGGLRLDESAARDCLSRLAAEMGAESPSAAAWGVVQVVNAAMERAIRRISVERGHDPRQFTLVAFGGAGPSHACEMAVHLAIPQVLVPRAPGVLSALGMLIADVVKDYSLTVMRPAAGLTPRELAGLLAPLEARARRELAAEGVPRARLEPGADLRYRGQSFELTVPVTETSISSLQSQFHLSHARRYGHSHPDQPVEVVNLRVRAVGTGPRPAFQPLPPGGEDASGAEIGRKAAWFEQGGWRQSRLYRREALRAGNLIPGPAILFQLDATTVIPPGWRGRVGRSGHLLLARAGESGVL
ncbi:MAG: hydantoinase/oxoprolinase family protein [Chloroflexi bacterium]|nr:hydantoinase/oxoprolinase family protein [Chloroflexota bacterium]